jgi:hypothetical protein
MQNGFNTGRDLTLNIVGFDGAIHSFGLQTTFDAKQIVKKITIEGMDGLTRFLKIPGGWSGSFGYVKQDDLLDSYFAAMEAAYFNGQNIPASSVTETIQNTDGSTSQYRFTGVMLEYDDAGAWSGDADVKLKVSWDASRRIKVQ